MHWPAVAARAVATACAMAVVAGAFGSWGALSTVAEQAAIVRPTRMILAVLGAAALVLSGVPTRRRLWSLISAAPFAVAGILAYGEWGYEQDQAFHYGVGGSRWGLVLLVAAAAAGSVAAVVEGWLRSRPAASPGQPGAGSP